MSFHIARKDLLIVDKPCYGTQRLEDYSNDNFPPIHSKEWEWIECCCYPIE